MDGARRNLIAACRCGRTAVAIVGAPFLSVICCCESCRTAGRQFEQMPNAPPVVRADGGTEYCLYRKDRAKIVRGGENLTERRLTQASATRRVVALCCNTPMFADFTKGHWLTLYRARLPGEAPPPRARVMAKDAPAGTIFADDIPTYQSYPPSFVIKLVTSFAAMGFRRPAFTW